MESSKSPNAKAVEDPRSVLARWANDGDEWVRHLVSEVLSTSRAATADDLEYAYELFRQEKALDERVLPAEPGLQIDGTQDDAEEPLVITKLSEVAGVNALVAGAVIEPHEGLTILFGENGTGKTGYARVFKALAGSRTADAILGDIAAATEVPQSAKIEYTLGNQPEVFDWDGKQAQVPFTRISIFDSPSVNFHVDDELEYVYVPTVLALFNHVVAAIKAVQAKIDSTMGELAAGPTTLLSRFPKDSDVYPLIETLGASTDLDALKAKASSDPNGDEKIDAVRKAVASLEADTMAAQITSRQRSERVLTQAIALSEVLVGFKVDDYNTFIAERLALQEDYKTFRSALFSAAALPTEPEGTWEALVENAAAYEAHLVDVGVHDDTRCPYCRQTLSAEATELLGKYSEYLADKISADISAKTVEIDSSTKGLRAANVGEVTAMIAEYTDRDDKPDYFAQLTLLTEALASYNSSIKLGEPINSPLKDPSATKTDLSAKLIAISSEIVILQDQVTNRAAALAEKKKEATALVAAAELTKSWTEIQGQVANAKEGDRLRILSKAIPGLGRAVTELSKTASDQLVNQSFDKLFIEECEALRAPTLKVEFIGRQGKAQRRKVMSGKHKPSKVLSEGEQKVLAMADFLAEARLSGITAPVIFDDPVSSLDHRRINEVAKRVANLAESIQVIVFTHDIFFATTLLSLFEKSKRCTYYQIPDEDGKGKITHATGPRWDTLASLKKNINETIQAAKLVDGEARASLVRTGYDWIRSWCEVFTETELLKGVTQRYQPNVRMTTLADIKTAALPSAIGIVSRIFENACRFIDGHSQPLVTLGVSPTLNGLEAHWQELQDGKKAYDAA
jgi:hypothetical protein